MLGVQIIGILLGLLMLYLTFLSFKRKEFNVKELVFWLGAWVLFIVVTMFPYLMEYFTRKMSLQRPLDALIIFGFVFLIILGFYNYSKNKKIMKKVETLVQRIAFEKVEDKEKVK
ncbi:MAG: DUF2304 domain-containing protein [Candidatus Woesearchaeota archaeon]|jgi:hypothetical protein